MHYEVLENPKFSKGDRVAVTRDVKLHFGGVLKKGETGTYLMTELVGTGRWIKVAMDRGFNMSFIKDDDIELTQE